jgi:glycosyltransferase involved in cell wall biosynthesis
LKKIIFIHNNYEPEQFPKEPDVEDKFYTYGFGSNFARNFKQYCPKYNVEMWRLDGHTRKYYEKTVQNVLFRVFPAFRINKFGEVSFKFISELKKEVRKNDPLLFVSNVHTWLLYQIAWLFKNSKIITSHHGDWSPFFRLNQRKGIRKLKDRVDAAIEKKVLNNVDYFLVCDYNEIPFIKEAAPKAKFKIFSSGLNMDGFQPIDKMKAREILGWDKNKKYIIYVGKLYDLKQSNDLIDIWTQIKKEHDNIELVIIGNSPTDEFNNYAVESGAKVLGRIPNKELNKYYSASDVYVLMSLRNDYFGGTGIAPLESLACNTPVVSYSMKNYIGDNLSDLGEAPGTLTGYKEAILKVLRNPEHYKNMRESIEKYYTYEKISKKIEMVVEELLNKSES